MQPLELDALRMGQEQQVDRLVDRLQLYLDMIVGKKEAVVSGDDQPRQTAPRRLDAKLLEQRHTDGPQQQVSASCRRQLVSQPFHLPGHFLGRQSFCSHFGVQSYKSIPRNKNLRKACGENL